MENKYGLTFPQKNIWLVEKFFGKSPINTIVGIFNVNKEFDKDICEKAINKMVEVNDALRIKVIEENDEAVQYVDNYAYFSVDFFDVTDKTEEERKELENKLTTLPFEVVDNPLYYFAIVKTGEDRGYIFVKLHHLVSDAWTFGNVATSLAEYIDLFTENREDEISKPSYVDFIEAEQEYIKSDKFAKDKEFWNEYLSGLEENVGLKENSNETLIDAKRYTVRLDEKLNTMIKNYCKENRVSPYTVFMNALSIYLHRVTEKTDFVIGTPVLNRSNFKEKKMMGMFVSTMPVRFKIDEKETFFDMCKKSASETMTLFRHQKYPYSLMLQDFREKNNVNTNLYSVMISYQNARAEYSDNEKYTTDWMFSTKVQDQFAIHIMDMDETGTLQVHFDYLVDLFEDIEIEYISKRLFTIIEDGITNNKTIETIEIMPEEEKNKILYEFNDTKTDYPKDKTVIDLFEEQVQKTPNNIALVFEGKEMTYKELNEKANILAWYLKDQGVKCGDVVAILMERNVSVFVSILATLKTGCTYLPIDMEFPKDRIEYMIKDSNACMVLQDNLTLQKYNFGNSFNVENINDNKKQNINLSNINNNCYILYTSGSTGNPKGVEITNKNVTNFVFAMSAKLGIKENLNFLCITTISFDIFVLESLLPLSFGHKVILANSNQQLNYAELSKLCLDTNVDLVQTTPSRYELILENNSSEKWIEKCKYILIGGENVKDKIIEQLIDITQSKIFNVYGPTETTVWSTANEIINIDDNNIGTPIGNTQIYILDNKKRIMPINVPGNLFIGGDSVANGYLNNNKLTEEKFINYNGKRIYDTGDLVILKNDGILKYIGRKDFQVKVNGHRIELGEIENELSKQENIYGVAVTVEQNKIVAYLRCSNIDIQKINTELKKKLPNYMIPNEYIKVNDFIYTNSGKINKKKLNDIKEKTIISFNKQIKKVSTETEKRVESIVKKILGKEEAVNIFESFIEMGMDSIQIIRLTTSLVNEFNRNITFEEVFNSNIHEIANKILHKELYKEKSIIENIDQVELSDTQKNIFSAYVMNNSTKAYNMPCEIKFNLTTNIEVLMEAIEKTFNRHSIFKSNIYIKDAVPYIKINKNRKINVETYNIKEQEYSKIKEEFVRPFDLLNDILVKIHLYITEKNIYMLFDSHHIIIDGISIYVIIKEIEDRYNGKEKLDKIDNGFINYLATTEKEANINNDNEIDIDDISKIEYDSIERNITEEAITEKVNISLEETIKIKKICKTYNVTPNSIFLSALKILIAKFTNNDNVMLGVVTSGRKKLEEQQIIGMFSNTQPYKSVIDWNSGIKDYVSETEKDVIELINKKGTKTNLPINIAYTYQNTNQSIININGINVVNRLNYNIAKFDISFEVFPNEQEYEILLQYKEKLYCKEKINSLFKSYKICILNIIDSFEKNLNDIELLSHEDKLFVLKEFNRVNQDKFNRIEEEFSNNVSNDNIAVIHNDKKITYKELDEKSTSLANKLYKNGIKCNDVIAVYMDKGIDFIISILGILKVGAIYLPIDPQFPIDRVSYMLNDSKTRLIVTKSTVQTINNELDIIYIDKEELNCSNFVLPEKTNIQDAAYIMYTSGTSGNPKGAINTHRGIIRLVKDTDYIKVTKNDNVALTGTISFDASIFEIWVALLNGATLHVLDKDILLDPISLEKYLIQNDISIMLLTTSLFTKLALINPKMFEKVRYLLTGGDVFSSTAGNNIIDFCKNTNLINAYGPTENAVISTIYNYNKKNEGEVPIGKPIQNTSIYIMDKCLKILPPYASGQLYVGGAGVGNGYVNNIELTDKVFLNNPYDKEKIYNTGDLVTYDEKYDIWFKGRKDNQIKIRGYRIELEEIKNKILNITGIKDAYVLAQNKNIHAFIVSNKENNVKELLKKQLPDYMLPKKIYNLQQIPNTVNGKVNKIELLNYIDKDTKLKKLPNTNFEKQMHDVWCKVLGKEDFGITDNFFDIGGDSILATEVILECANRNIPITYSDLYNYLTIEELSNISLKNMDEVYSLKDIDLNELNKLVKSNNKGINIEKKRDIIITGATGFLGAHIVEELINQEDCRKVYCIVRSKNGISGEQRLYERLHFFFDDKLDKYYNNTIIPIEADILNESEISSAFDEIDLSNVGTIINSAAYVKHFDMLDRFIKFNVETTKNVAMFALKHNLKLYHVSTLSVSGNMLETGQVKQDIKEKLYYDEETFFINQKLYNGYAYSKFLSEIEVLKLTETGLDATILRMGNLTGRYSDGKFQPNVEENAFANRIKAFMHIGYIPKGLEQMYLEFTPIDYASKAIVKIAEDNPKGKMLHLFNHNHIYMDKLLNVLEKINVDIQIVEDKKFNSELEQSMSKKDQEIEGIIIDINEDKEIKYISNIIVNSEKTIKYLEKLGFNWPVISDEYIIKYFRYLKNIGFLKF